MLGVRGMQGLLDGQPGRLRLAGGAADRRVRGRRWADVVGVGSRNHERVREGQAGRGGEDQRVQERRMGETETYRDEVRREAAQRSIAAAAVASVAAAYFVNRVFR